jgi:hypothetical protein
MQINFLILTSKALITAKRLELKRKNEIKARRDQKEKDAATTAAITASTDAGTDNAASVPGDEQVVSDATKQSNDSNHNQSGASARKRKNK